MELPVSLPGAVLGGRIQVPTVTGRVTMTIPKSSDTGTQLRLRGKGIHKKRRGSETSGDQGFPTGTGVSMAFYAWGLDSRLRSKAVIITAARRCGGAPWLLQSPRRR